MSRYFTRESRLVAGFALLMVITPVLVVWFFHTILDLTLPKAAGVVGSIGTLILVGLGGLFAIYQFRLFRHNAPHLSVSQVVSHKELSPNYVAIVVTVRLTNNSKVVVRIYDTLFRIQEFDQLSDEKVEELYVETFIDEENNYVQWPTLDVISRKWSPGEITIEPSESHTETYEFIVAKRFKSVMVYSMFYNPYSTDDDDGRRGWHATTVYSIEDQ